MGSKKLLVFYGTHIHYRVYRTPVQNPNGVSPHPRTLFRKTCSNIILPYTRTSSKWPNAEVVKKETCTHLRRIINYVFRKVINFTLYGIYLLELPGLFSQDCESKLSKTVIIEI